MRAMRLLRAKQQIVERQIEQCERRVDADAGTRPFG
jgi:hypothetical protein